MGSLITGILTNLSLIPALSQTATNGYSSLGTLDAPQYPAYLTNNPLPQGFPWGTKGAETTNPYEDCPTTGVIRPYDFTIARGIIAPDGVNRSVILVNGRFPGPTIESNWGDTIQVTVHNHITSPEEGTAIHWHGLLQKDTPWFDGVPGVGQCPIAPGKSLTYTFKAELYGTTWYHSHYSAQYSAGVLGPLIIHGPQNAPYDTDLGPVTLNDWFHQDYFSLLEGVMKPAKSVVFGQTVPLSDNNLINGKMNYDCSLVTNGDSCTPNDGLSKFQFQSNKTHRLRLINAGSEGTQRFTIDHHNMTVIANDFVPIRPYETNVVTLAVGQRTDILVTAKLSPNSSVFMRSDISSEPCSFTNQPHALAVIYYENADVTKTPVSRKTIYDGTHCGNDPLASTTPFFPYNPIPEPATILQIDVIFQPNSTGTWLCHPLLLLANLGNITYPYDPQWNVYNINANTSVRLIIRNFSPAAHPMHLHGHNFFVLAEGVGIWDGTITNAFNPQRRDTHLLQLPKSRQDATNPDNPGYLVVQYETDNPGVWPFHCHIAWHASGGLFVNLMEQVEGIRKRVIFSTIAETCREWADYSGHNVVEQIDSGL